jgi:uncharacterized protein (DUF2141 family)
MRSVTTFFTLAFLTSFAIGGEGYSLTVTVTNIPGAKGNLLIGLYNSEASFTGDPLPISPKIPVMTTDDVNATIENLKPGTYAVAVIQDLNGNGELDRNFLGMPKEPLAFSVITEIPRGKPAFAACAFEIQDADVALTIPLVLR